MFNNFTRTVRMKQNKRIFKYTALVIDAADSNQQNIYADIPGAANATGFMGFLNDQHFIEPGGLYFVPQGTNPTTVTGSVPGTYSLAGRNATIVNQGETFAIAAGVVAEGDLLAIADSSGRVNNMANLGLTISTANIVARALQPSTAANDLIRVRIVDKPVA